MAALCCHGSMLRFHLLLFDVKNYVRMMGDMTSHCLLGVVGLHTVDCATVVLALLA